MGKLKFFDQRLHLTTDWNTVELRFNEPLFIEVLDITNDTPRPGQIYSKMYAIGPRYNEPRNDEIPRYNEDNPEAKTVKSTSI